MMKKLLALLLALLLMTGAAAAREADLSAYSAERAVIRNGDATVTLTLQMWNGVGMVSIHDFIHAMGYNYMDLIDIVHVNNNAWNDKNARLDVRDVSELSLQNGTSMTSMPTVMLAGEAMAPLWEILNFFGVEYSVQGKTVYITAPYVVDVSELADASGAPSLLVVQGDGADRSLPLTAQDGVAVVPVEEMLRLLALDYEIVDGVVYVRMTPAAPELTPMEVSGSIVPFADITWETTEADMRAMGLEGYEGPYAHLTAYDLTKLTIGGAELNCYCFFNNQTGKLESVTVMGFLRSGDRNDVFMEMIACVNEYYGIEMAIRDEWKAKGYDGNAYTSAQLSDYIVSDILHARHASGQAGECVINVSIENVNYLESGMCGVIIQVTR